MAYGRYGQLNEEEYGELLAKRFDQFPSKEELQKRMEESANDVKKYRAEEDRLRQEKRIEQEKLPVLIGKQKKAEAAVGAQRSKMQLLENAANKQHKLACNAAKDTAMYKAQIENRDYNRLKHFDEARQNSDAYQEIMNKAVK